MSRFQIPVVFILFCCALISKSDGQTVSKINALITKLMEGYNKETLPTNNRTKPFPVKITAYILAIGELDEPRQKLSTVMGFEAKWTDESMIWNPETVNYMQNVTMSPHSMWKPYLYVYNKYHTTEQTVGNKKLPRISYYPNGTAVWFYSKICDTSCIIDNTYFPFGVQNCDIKFVVSDKDVELNVELKSTKDKSNDNGPWEQSSVRIKNGGNYYVLSFSYTSKPLFIILNVLIPILFLSLLAPLVFIFPYITGEKVGFSTQTLLANSVFMTIINDFLPKHIYPLPLVSTMLFVFSTINTIAVSVVCVNKLINDFSEEKPVPYILQCVVKLLRCPVRLFKNLSFFHRRRYSFSENQDNEICEHLISMKYINEDYNSIHHNISIDNGIPVVNENNTFRKQSSETINNLRKSSAPTKLQRVKQNSETERSPLASLQYLYQDSKPRQVQENETFIDEDVVTDNIACLEASSHSETIDAKEEELNVQDDVKITWQDVVKNMDIFCCVFMYTIEIIYVVAIVYFLKS